MNNVRIEFLCRACGRKDDPSMLITSLGFNRCPSCHSTNIATLHTDMTPIKPARTKDQPKTQEDAW